MDGRTEGKEQDHKLPREVTGLATSFNYARDRPCPTRPLRDFFNTEEPKAALGARRDVASTRCSRAVSAALAEDVMRITKGNVDAVLAWTENGTARVRVLLFQGVFDLHSAPASVATWVRELA
jgi:vitellogenic carboxypeptidase-like protein